MSATADRDDLPWLSTRVLCARFPHLGLLAAWRRFPELRGEPVVVGGRPELRLPVVAASAAAQAAGVRAGQPLRQAQQLCPAAVFIPLDEAAVDQLRMAAITALWAVTPAVEVGDEEAWCDLGGRHAAFAGEPAWAAATARALTGALDGEAPAVGVAGSRFVAWVAAGRAAPRRVRRVRSGEEAGFLAPLPVGLLPVDHHVVARLVDLGIDCLGAVAALSPADLSRQFGAEGLVAHRHARGEDGDTLTPYAAPHTAAERLALDGPVFDRESLRCAGHALCERLGDRLRRRGLTAARLDLVLESDTAEAAATRVPPAPAGSAEELWPAVLGLLGAVQPGAPVTAVRLVAGDLATATGRQVDLWRRGDAAGDAVTRTVARLDDRFGPGSVLRPRLAVDPGDIPERRFTWEPADPRGVARVPVAP